jgi:hypothetical protein
LHSDLIDPAIAAHHGRDEPSELHPFVKGLLRKLQKAGDIRPEAKRKLWLDTAAGIFKMIYKEEPALCGKPLTE